MIGSKDCRCKDSLNSHYSLPLSICSEETKAQWGENFPKATERMHGGARFSVQALWVQSLHTYLLINAPVQFLFEYVLENNKENLNANWEL